MLRVPRQRHKTLRELGRVPEWLTAGQAAELLQVHTATVRVWIREGRVPSQKFGGSRRIPRDDLLATRRAPSAPTPSKPDPSVPAPLARTQRVAQDPGEDGGTTTISNAEAAQMLGVSRATVERWVRAGRFTLVAVGANKGKRRIVHDQRFDLLATERSLR